MIFIKSFLLRLTLSSLVVLIAGCSSKAPPGTVWVTGTVAHQGTPLPEGMIHFVPPQDSAPGSGAATRIDGGRFGLYLQPGKYGLAILSPQGVEAIDPKTGRLIPPPSRISLDYGSVTTSGLEAAVDASHRRVDLRLDR
jgi:hypothetical protein